MGRWIRFFLLGVLLCLGMAGCSGQNEEEESGYRIWYINKDETRLAYECREMRAENTEGLLNEALEFLREEPEDENYKPPLPEDVRLALIHL